MSKPVPAPSVLSPLTAVLRRFLPDYLRLVEPDTAEHLRLDRLAILDLPPAAPPLHGVVAEALTRKDETVTVLALVEPEPLSPAGTAKLFGGWLELLELRYCRPVLLSVLYLQGGRPSLNLETTWVAKVAGLDVVRLYFTAFGLSGARAAYYLDRPQPIAWALAALMGYHGSSEELRERCKTRIATAEAPLLEDGDRDLLARLVDAVGQDSDQDSEGLSHES